MISSVNGNGNVPINAAVKLQQPSAQTSLASVARLLRKSTRRLLFESFVTAQIQGDALTFFSLSSHVRKKNERPKK